LRRASSVYGLPDLTFKTVAGEDTVTLVLHDKENDTSNTYEQIVPGCCTDSFSLDVKIENIRVMPGQYSVKVSKHLISEWKNFNTELVYYIALEP